MGRDTPILEVEQLDKSDRDENNEIRKQKQKQASIRDGEFNGRIIRDYKIMSPIGQGKFSFVFKALN